MIEEYNSLYKIWYLNKNATENFEKNVQLGIGLAGGQWKEGQGEGEMLIVTNFCRLETVDGKSA